MVNLTKKAITDTFLKLLNEHPFDKITVKDIVEECGVNRNTFYYHYHDIYELLEELLENEHQKIASDNMTYESWQEAILQTASFAFANKKALYHLYNSISRRQIESYITEATDRGIRSFISGQAKGRQISEGALSMIVMLYKSAVVGMILQWLDDNMKHDPEELIQKTGILMEGTLEVMLTNAQKSNF